MVFFPTGKMNISRLIPLPPNKAHYDIIAQHFVYEKEKVDSLFGENKFILSIIRDPVERFISALNFLGMPREIRQQLNKSIHEGDPLYTRYKTDHPIDWKVLPLTDKAEILFNMVEFTFDDNLRKRFFSGNKMFFNNIANDLGFSQKKLVSPLIRVSKEEIKNFIEIIDKQMDLILIQEHFDEGMLVLANALNMKMYDVLYIAENSKASEIISKTKTDLIYTPQLSQEIINKIKYYSQVDVRIYEHFRTKFESEYRVSEEALADYRANLLKVYSSCVCARDKTGLFGTFSYVLCPDQENNGSCRELLTDSISIQYIAAGKQCTLANSTCRNNMSMNRKLKNKRLISKGWEFNNLHPSF